MLNNMIIRLLVYYAAWLLALSGIFYLFPQILYYVSQERKRIFVAKSLEFGADTVPFPLGNIEEGVLRLVDPAHTIPVMVALVLAFGVTLPVTWVYRWTRPRKKYSQSFAHTLLVIPTSITLVVFLVKGSLALAFSLAGIVAAVRFRTSLEEPMDAVYMFMAIGIGLAAGTQLTTVAYLASLVFVAIALGVWKSNFGARPAVISGWTIVYPDKSAQVSETNDTAIPTQKPCDAQIEVHATNVEEVQKATDMILNSNTKRWQVADVINNEDETVVVVFDIWFKKSVNPLSLVRHIEESGKNYINDIRVRVNSS